MVPDHEMGRGTGVVLALFPSRACRINWAAHSRKAGAAYKSTWAEDPGAETVSRGWYCPFVANVLDFGATSVQRSPSP